MFYGPITSTPSTSIFSGGLDSKESACNEGDPGSVPGMGGSPWRREWLPTLVFLPGESYGQRSLVVIAINKNTLQRLNPEESHDCF